MQETRLQSVVVLRSQCIWKVARPCPIRRRLFANQQVRPSRSRRLAQTAMNQTCRYNCAFRCMANWQQLKCPTVVDAFIKAAFAIYLDGRIRSPRGIEIDLNRRTPRLIDRSSKPAAAMIRPSASTSGANGSVLCHGTRACSTLPIMAHVHTAQSPIDSGFPRFPHPANARPRRLLHFANSWHGPVSGFSICALPSSGEEAANPDRFRRRQ